MDRGWGHHLETALNRSGTSQWAICPRGWFTGPLYIWASPMTHVEHIDKKRSDLTFSEPCNWIWIIQKSKWDLWLGSFEAANTGYASSEREDASASLINGARFSHRLVTRLESWRRRTFHTHLAIGSFSSTGAFLISNLTQEPMSWHTEDQPAANSCESRHLRG